MTELRCCERCGHLHGEHKRVIRSGRTWEDDDRSFCFCCDCPAFMDEPDFVARSVWEAMSGRPRIADLFSCAGGAARGYHDAGFEVVGFDVEPQPNYPYEHHIADALDVDLSGFDAVHASPPCQSLSSMNAVNVARGNPSMKPNLIPPTREKLSGFDGPWVIENVAHARKWMRDPVTLCGSMFGLRVRRHRLFESNVLLLRQHCQHRGFDFVGVYSDHPQVDRPHPDGHDRKPRAATLEEGQAAMGIDWMIWTELVEAIPPAYTEHIGRQLIAHLESAAA